MRRSSELPPELMPLPTDLMGASYAHELKSVVTRSTGMIQIKTDTGSIASIMERLDGID